jgi:hypothetical protein
MLRRHTREISIFFPTLSAVLLLSIVDLLTLGFNIGYTLECVYVSLLLSTI